MIFAYLKEGFRIYRRSKRVKKHGVLKYTGDAKHICNQIVADCWNGLYFQTSAGHFSEFYMRDFGWCVDALLQLGYRREVEATLQHVLKIYARHHLTTTITPSGACIDIFTYSPDSLAYLLYSLRVAHLPELVKKYKGFLNKEIRRFAHLCFDSYESRIKDKKVFGSMKDHAKRKSSTYDNTMLAVISREANALGLENPMKTFNIKNVLVGNYWNGSYFYDDMNENDYVSGDSNVVPFWFGIVEDQGMLRSALKSIHDAKLDEPFPLKYSATEAPVHLRLMDRFAKGYERDAIWMHMGLMYLKLLKKIKSPLFKSYLDAYTTLIKDHKNFLEVFTPKGKPFQSPFYYADEGMLWCANYLALLE